MAQRQFRTDDTSLWIERFGNGSDGAYSPSTSTDAPIDSACTGTISTTSLSATNASFATGQLILIHQTQGTGAGQWELNRISSYATGTITTAYSLIYGYATGAQVVVIPQYSTGNIAGGVTIIGKAWNGTTGGIYTKFFSGALTIAGTLTVGGTGYRGATLDYDPGGRDGAKTGYNGENYTQASTQNGNSATANGGGGGGYQYSPAGAGGGGHAASGSNGSDGGAGNVGIGGGTGGSASLVTAILGGGGGRGGAWSGADPGGIGGAGGGLVFVCAKSITITGSISSNGANGAAGNGASSGDTRVGASGGGGGAGGSVLIKGQTVTLGSSLVTSSAGSGGGHTNFAGNGGAGGVGRIHIDYSQLLSGTTSPTLDSSVDAILNDLPNQENYTLLI